jgi:hypothetical protein
LRVQQMRRGEQGQGTETRAAGGGHAALANLFRIGTASRPSPHQPKGSQTNLKTGDEADRDQKKPLDPGSVIGGGALPLLPVDGGDPRAGKGGFDSHHHPLCCNAAQ